MPSSLLPRLSWWTKMSSPPVSGLANPKPFFRSNHLIVAVCCAALSSACAQGAAAPQWGAVRVSWAGNGGGGSGLEIRPARHHALPDAIDLRLALGDDEPEGGYAADRLLNSSYSRSVAFPLLNDQDLVSEIHGVSTLRGAWARPINQVAGRASAPVDLHRDENGSEALPAPALSSSSSRLPRRARERLLGREALSTERARRDSVPGSGQVNAWRCPFHGNPGRARRRGGDRCPT